MSIARSNLPVVACGVGLLIACSTATRAQAYDSDVWPALFGPAPEVAGDWPRNLRVGAVVGFNLKADFSTSGKFAVSGSDPGTPGGGQNHEYDDGYVRLDATGNNGGLTWNWGYENASQLAGQLLYFHSAQSFTASGSANVSGDAQVGFDSAYDGRLFPLWGGSFGWELGFGVLPIKIQDNQPMSASVTRIVHSFDASGIDAFPTPPYHGGFTGPSVTIGDSVVAESSVEAVPAMLTGSRTIDVVLYNFRLGPTLRWEFHPRLALAVSAGAAFGIASGDLKYDETLVFPDGSTARNQGQVGNTELVYGGYLAGTLMYHAVKHGDFYLGLQYMPLSSATFSGAGREATLQMSGGLYLSAGLNWPF